MVILFLFGLYIYIYFISLFLWIACEIKSFILFYITSHIITNYTQTTSQVCILVACRGFEIYSKFHILVGLRNTSIQMYNIKTNQNVYKVLKLQSTNDITHPSTWSLKNSIQRTTMYLPIRNKLYQLNGRRNHKQSIRIWRSWTQTSNNAKLSPITSKSKRIPSG